MSRLSSYDELREITERDKPHIALILGSGLSGIADRLEDAVDLPFGVIPGLDTATVPGHRGVLLLGRWADVPVVVFAGRLHYYEGHPWRTVVQPIHIANELGASLLIATNAAGGVRDDLRPGDLMAIRGHLDCTRANWWRPANAKPQAEYSPRLLALLSLPTGVYAQLTGPTYETPAEIRALRTCGVDAVGMSTAREIEAASELGMECAAISCITNKAAGLGGAIHHDDVLEVGRKVNQRVIGVLDALVQQVAV